MLEIDGNTIRAIVQTYRGPRAVVQDQVIAEIGPVLAETLQRSKIDTSLRIGHFLAQMCEECEDFTAMEEQGPRSYFNQYAGKMGNLPPDDCYTFRGRGLIQLTGRDNYDRYGHALSCDLITKPELAADPKVALLVACQYWNDKNINTPADKDDIIEVTKRINGGETGLDQRRAYLTKVKPVLAKLGASQAVADAGPQPADSPVLHLGLDVPRVLDLQRLLSAAGYPLTVDGVFGLATEIAVKIFQQKCALPADGIVGPVTWTKLRQEAA